MKQLSYWAYMNPVKSRIIIGLCQILLSGIAIYTGIWLFALDILIPMHIFYTGLTLFFIAFICYPIRRARYAFWKFHYGRQKIMDFLIVVSYMLMVTSAANFDAHAAWNDYSQEYRAEKIVLKNESSINVGEPGDPKPWTAKEIRKDLKKKYKKYLSERRLKAQNNSDDEKKAVGMVLLTILLMLLVVILACGVACSTESVAAFFLIWLIGWALVLWLGISSVRRIKGKSKTKYEPMQSG